MPLASNVLCNFARTFTATITTMRIAQWRRCPVPGRNSPHKHRIQPGPPERFPAGGLCYVRLLDRPESHNSYEGYSQ